MTEEEAKTKACFRAATFAGSQQIADGPGPHCIGSACMAWRTTSADLSRLELEARIHRPEVVHLVQRAMMADGQGGGFCGLAGAAR